MKQKNKNLKYLLFVNLFSLIGYYTFAPLYALFAHGFIANPRTISLIWGGYSLLQACFLLLFGWYGNRKQKGKLVVAGYFICSLGALSFLMVHDELSLALVLSLNALGAGITLPAYKTLFAHNELKGKESEQWSWLDAGNMFAAALGGALGGLIVGVYGFNGIFITMATIQLLAACIAYRSLYTLK